MYHIEPGEYSKPRSEKQSGFLANRTLQALWRFLKAPIPRLCPRYWHFLGLRPWWPHKISMGGSELQPELTTTGKSILWFRSFFFYNCIYLFIHFWLCWIFIAAPAFSLVAVSEGSSRVAVPGLTVVASLLYSRGSKAYGLPSLAAAGGLSVVAPRLQSTGSIVVAQGLRCSLACGVFPDQGLNPCLLHWQVDSLPLSNQGSPDVDHSCSK